MSVNKNEAVKETEVKKAQSSAPTSEDKGFNNASKPYFKKGFNGKRKRKFCKCCAKGIQHIDYKDVDLLKKYLNHHLKIVPARISGTCSMHQRRISNAIKRARIVALIPFVIQD